MPTLMDPLDQDGNPSRRDQARADAWAAGLCICGWDVARSSSGNRLPPGWLDTPRLDSDCPVHGFRTREHVAELVHATYPSVGWQWLGYPRGLVLVQILQPNIVREVTP